MVRRLLAALLVLVTVALAAPAGVAGADDASTTVAGDMELIEALAAAGLTTQWLETSPMSGQVALLHVYGSAEYDEARRDLLARLRLIGERVSSNDDRAQRLEVASRETEMLEGIALDLRRRVLTSTASHATSLTASEAQHARVALGAIRRGSGVVAFTMDRVDLVERRLTKIRELLMRDVASLSTQIGFDSKAIDAALGRFSYVPTEMAHLRTIISTERSLVLQQAFMVASEKGEAVALMDGLHSMRSLAPTSVGGLSAVTVDAYMRGAHAIEGRCAIDWKLLAGIGRVESRHGTLDEASVRASGSVTIEILGPLLDGGATKAEALQAEADALAEAERLAAEEAEAEAALAEEARAFNAEVWGEDTLERIKEVEAATVEAEAVGRAAVPVVEEEVPTPRFDPLIWGDDLPFSEEDLVDEAGLEEELDDDEDRFAPAGNGFAVIVDTDDGVLDGNSRWDRAVGPMQFIPETWSTWATDGNGDGVADPQNLYDAAATAGEFLCHLQQTRGWSPTSFVRGYNSSSVYVRNVLAVAEAFDGFTLPDVPES